VAVNGRDILTIESNCLSGISDIDRYDDTICLAADNLFGFVGRLAPQESREGSYAPSASLGKDREADRQTAELVERVAMALHDKWNGVGLWASKNTNAKDRWRFMARAAIEAMGERA